MTTTPTPEQIAGAIAKARRIYGVENGTMAGALGGNELAAEFGAALVALAAQLAEANEQIGRNIEAIGAAKQHVEKSEVRREEYLQRAKQAEAAVAPPREAFEKYGMHKYDCAANTTLNLDDCDCGFMETERALKSTPPAPVTPSAPGASASEPDYAAIAQQLFPVLGVGMGQARHKVQVELKRMYRLGLTRAPAPQEADGWRPIETAPKDGTPVLGWPCYSGRGVAQVVWRIMKRTTGRWEHQYGHATPIQPTAWRPLPAPPPAQEGDR